MVAFVTWCKKSKQMIGENMNNIILASASPRRQQLLTQIGLKFTVIPSNIDEVIEKNLEPHQAAISLASQKCTDVAVLTKTNSLVIGADTIVVKDNNLLGKPKNEQEALEMLKYLNGAWHEVVTGVCLCRTPDMKIIHDYEITRVKIAGKSEDFLKSYIATGEPFDKAGAYGIQGYGSLLVEKIEGCYFNVMGLPIYKLSCMLEQMGHIIAFKKA
jgi:septum formation protein